MLPTEDAYILKPNGDRLGPYKAKFAGSTVIVNDPKADIDDGDQVSRVLPSGKEEIKHIKECKFYSIGIGGQGPHYQLAVAPMAASQSYAHTTQNFNFNGGPANVQVGNHNKIEFTSHIHALKKIIDDSNASDAEKNEAKNLLQKFLEHPLVIAVAGSAVSGLL